MQCSDELSLIMQLNDEIDDNAKLMVCSMQLTDELIMFSLMMQFNDEFRMQLIDGLMMLGSIMKLKGWFSSCSYGCRGVSQEVYNDENRLQTTCRSSAAIVAEIHRNSKK
jgi:hypothetical protein